MALAEERDDPQYPCPAVLHFTPLVHSHAVQAAVAVTSESRILTCPRTHGRIAPWGRLPPQKEPDQPSPAVRGLCLGRASFTAALD